MRKILNSIPLAKAANWLLIVGFLVALPSVFIFQYKQKYSFNMPIDSSVFGDFGSFLSGTAGSLWSLASVIYFIVALREQRKEIAKNQKSQSLQSFESTFFQLLQLHSTTVNELVYRNYEGRSVFNRWKDCLDEFAINTGVTMVDDGYGNAVPVESPSISNFEDFKKYLEANYEQSYSTFEPTLSHYFRALYHIYKYVHKSKLIGDDDRKFYGSLIRAQLSQNELYAIAVNGLLPSYGYPKFMYLVGKYDFLKNFNHNAIPKGILWEYIKDVRRTCPNPFD